MNLREFRALCEREWGEARGDVVSLALTDDSFSEFLSAMLLNQRFRDYEPVLSPIRAHEIADIEDGKLTYAVNPVTRGAIRVTKGAAVDTAEVIRHYAEGAVSPDSPQTPGGGS